jgi:carbamoyltransferase
MDNDNENYLSVDEEGAIEFYPGKYIIRTQLEAIKQIASQQMVAIFQGQSEIGPRALGNRSLMFDPTNPRAKVIVNEIKEREDFRPFAGTILLEYFEEYFVTAGIEESPWMSYAIPVKDEKVQEISSIVHHDFTCRVQTVTEEQNKNYYNLIKAWHEESGCPVIFNTSFNLGGEAMVESLAHAVDTCERSAINFIYVPEDQDIPYIQNFVKTEEQLEELKEIIAEGQEQDEQEEFGNGASLDLTSNDAFINS